MKLQDYLQIKPDSSFEDLFKLNKHEKNALIDQMVSKGKALLVDLTLSHAGKRINNRVYTPQGQKRGITSLTSPFPKPIIKNHDSYSEPLGRFVGGTFVDRSSDAMKFFNRTDQMFEFRQAFDSYDPEKISNVMIKTGLISNPGWLGLSSMNAQAKINDTDAIQKFLDGRFLTFSAGSSTDRYVCSVCFSDWHKDEICEHYAGSIYDDKPCFFITGDFSVREGSIVNNPADEGAQVISMELTDSVRSKIEDFSSLRIDKVNIFMSDSVYSFEKEETPKEGSVEVEKENKTEAKDETESVLEPVVALESPKDEEVQNVEPLKVEEVDVSKEDVDPSKKEKAEFDKILEQILSSLTEIKTSLTQESSKKESVEEKDLSKDKSELDELKEDHVKLLKRFDSLKEKTDALLAHCVEANPSCTFDKDATLEERVTMFISASKPKGKGNETMTDKVVVNPSIGGKDNQKLGDFEKSFISRYKQILDTKGQSAADSYYKQNKLYLPRKFNPLEYIGDN